VKTFKVIVDGQSYTVQVEELKEESKQNESTRTVEQPKTPEPDSDSAPVSVKEPAVSNQKATSSPGSAPEGKIILKAPMPGSVLEVKVSVGDKVEAGDVLLVLEAMKMENELPASQAGTVEQVLVTKGDTVNSEDTLVIMS